MTFKRNVPTFATFDKTGEQNGLYRLFWTNIKVTHGRVKRMSIRVIEKWEEEFSKGHAEEIRA